MYLAGWETDSFTDNMQWRIHRKQYRFVRNIHHVRNPQLILPEYDLHIEIVLHAPDKAISPSVWLVKNLV